jgi:hypothetical protein
VRGTLANKVVVPPLTSVSKAFKDKSVNYLPLPGEIKDATSGPYMAIIYRKYMACLFGSLRLKADIASFQVMFSSMMRVTSSSILLSDI